MLAAYGIYIMSGGIPIVCHCEWNEVKRRNHKVFGIAYFGRNDGYLNGHDIT